MPIFIIISAISGIFPDFIEYIEKHFKEKYYLLAFFTLRASRSSVTNTVKQSQAIASSQYSSQ